MKPIFDFLMSGFFDERGRGEQRSSKQSEKDPFKIENRLPAEG
jgi:hypothetical protein